MLRRIALSWDLMWRCLSVLRAEPGLLVLSLLGLLAGLLLVASFVAPMVAAGLDPLPRAGSADPLHYGLLALFYLAGAFVATFTNAAVVAAAVERMRGGRLGVGDALRAAAACGARLAGWALLAATVGYLLKLVQSRSNLLGRIAGGVFGIAWSFATFLVVPVLVVEGLGPLEGIRRSTALVRRTWGEHIVSRVSFGYVFFLLSLPGLAIVGLFLLSWGTWPPFPWMIVTVAYLVGLGLVCSTLGGILQAALYLHAGGQSAAGPFDDDVLAAALG